MEKIKLDYYNPNTFEHSDVEYNKKQHEVATEVRKSLKQLFESDKSLNIATPIVLNPDDNELSIGVFFRNDITDKPETYVISIKPKL